MRDESLVILVLESSVIFKKKAVIVLSIITIPERYGLLFAVEGS